MKMNNKADMRESVIHSSKHLSYNSASEECVVVGHKIVTCFTPTDVQCNLISLSSGSKQTAHVNWVLEERVNVIRGTNKG